MATLWHFLMPISSVHTVVRRALAKTLALKRNSTRYVIISLKIRRSKWPPLPSVQEKNYRRKQNFEVPGAVLATQPVEAPSAAPVIDTTGQDSDQFRDQASSLADEGEVSEVESTGPDCEELLDVDQELTAEQTQGSSERC